MERLNSNDSIQLPVLYSTPPPAIREKIEAIEICLRQLQNNGWLERANKLAWYVIDDQNQMPYWQINDALIIYDMEQKKGAKAVTVGQWNIVTLGARFTLVRVDAIAGTQVTLVTGNAQRTKVKEEELSHVARVLLAVRLL